MTAQRITTNSAGRRSPLERLAIVDSILSREDTRILHVDIVSEGREIHHTKAPLRRTRISYLGGSVCVYLFMGPDGLVGKSASLCRFTGKSYRAGEIPRIENLRAPVAPRGVLT